MPLLVLLQGLDEYAINLHSLTKDLVPVMTCDVQVELQFHGNVDVREKDAIFNYRRKYLPTQQVEKQ